MRRAQKSNLGPVWARTPPPPPGLRRCRRQHIPRSRRVSRPAGAYRQAARERIGCAFASWCINRHVDGGLELPLKLVQTRLGHASIQMTADRYGHLFPRGDDGAELAAAETAT